MVQKGKEVLTMKANQPRDKKQVQGEYQSGHTWF